MNDSNALYTRTFAFGFVTNFLVGLLFNNNQIYPLFVKAAGGGPEQIGLFMSVLTLSGMFGRPLVGPLIDRWGERPIMIMGALAMTAPALGFRFLIGEPFTWMTWALRVVQGLGFGAYFTGFFTFAGRVAPVHRRNEAVAMYGASGLVAALFGVNMGEWVVAFAGLEAFFPLMVSLGLAACITILRLKALRPGSGSGPTGGGFLNVLFSRRLFPALLLAFMLGVASHSIPAFVADVARVEGFSGFGLYATAFGASAICVRLVGRQWGDRYGPGRVLVPAFVIYGLGLLAFSMMLSFPGVIVAGTLCGAAHGVAFPAVMSFGFSRAPSGALGTGMAIVTGASDMGAAGAAAAFGQIAGVWGYGAIFPIAATCAAVGAIAAITVRQRREA